MTRIVVQLQKEDLAYKSLIQCQISYRNSVFSLHAKVLLFHWIQFVKILWRSYRYLKINVILFNFLSEAPTSSEPDLRCDK